MNSEQRRGDAGAFTRGTRWSGMLPGFLTPFGATHTSPLISVPISLPVPALYLSFNLSSRSISLHLSSIFHLSLSRPLSLSLLLSFFLSLSLSLSFSLSPCSASCGSWCTGTSFSTGVAPSSPSAEIKKTKADLKRAEICLLCFFHGLAYMIKIFLRLFWNDEFHYIK